MGVDGAGKTTLAKSLVNSLNQKGVKATYVYNRFQPFLMRFVYALGKLMFLRKQNMFEDYVEYSVARKKVFRNSAVLIVYRWMIFFEYSMQVALKTFIRLAFGKVLICDRYIYDTVINDIAVDLGYSDEQLLNELNLYFRFFPKPDLVFFADIPEEVSMQRKNDIPSIDFIRVRRKYYLGISDQFNFVKLDGLTDLESLKVNVEKKVLSFLDDNLER